MERRGDKTSTSYFLSALEINQLVKEGILTQKQVERAREQLANMPKQQESTSNPLEVAYIIEVRNGDREPLEKAFHDLGLTIYDSNTN